MLALRKRHELDTHCVAKGCCRARVALAPRAAILLSVPDLYYIRLCSAWPDAREVRGKIQADDGQLPWGKEVYHGGGRRVRGPCAVGNVRIAPRLLRGVVDYVEVGR